MADFDFQGLLGNMFGGGGDSELEKLLTAKQREQLGLQSTLSAAAQLLKASGRGPQRIGLGQAIGSALEAGQGAYEKGTTNAFQQMLLAEKLREGQRARDLQTQVAGVLTKPTTALSPEMQALATPGMQAGPTVARAELAASIPQPSAGEIKAGQYQQIADIYAAQGKSEDAKRFQEMAEKLNPRAEVVGQPFEVTDTTGKPILVQQYKDGSTKTMAGFGPKRDVVLQNLNNQVVAIDKSKLTGRESFAMGMSPSEAANLQVARGNLAVAQGGLGLRQQEFARGAFDVKESPEGYAYIPKTPGAAAIPIMGAGGEQLKGVSGGKATEGERKAATLLSRMQLAQTQMNQGKEGMPGFLTSVTPRVGLPAERKRVEDAQLDFLDAALTLATGAAYTEFQLKGAMQSYFPKFGDDAQTIAEKETRRKNLMEAARLSAGTMSSAVPPPARTGSGGGTTRPSLGNIFGVPGG